MSKLSQKLLAAMLACTMMLSAVAAYTPVMAVEVVETVIDSTTYSVSSEDVQKYEEISSTSGYSYGGASHDTYVSLKTSVRLVDESGKEMSKELLTNEWNNLENGQTYTLQVRKVQISARKVFGRNLWTEVSGTEEWLDYVKVVVSLPTLSDELKAEMKQSIEDAYAQASEYENIDGDKLQEAKDSAIAGIDGASSKEEADAVLSTFEKTVKDLKSAADTLSFNQAKEDAKAHVQAKVDALKEMVNASRLDDESKQAFIKEINAKKTAFDLELLVKFNKTAVEELEAKVLGQLDTIEANIQDAIKNYIASLPTLLETYKNTQAAQFETLNFEELLSGGVSDVNSLLELVKMFNNDKLIHISASKQDAYKQSLESLYTEGLASIEAGEDDDAKIAAFEASKEAMDVLMNEAKALNAQNLATKEAYFKLKNITLGNVSDVLNSVKDNGIAGLFDGVVVEESAKASQTVQEMSYLEEIQIQEVLKQLGLDLDLPLGETSKATYLTALTANTLSVMVNIYTQNSDGEDLVKECEKEYGTYETVNNLLVTTAKAHNVLGAVKHVNDFTNDELARVDGLEDVPAYEKAILKAKVRVEEAKAVADILSGREEAMITPVVEAYKEKVTAMVDELIANNATNSELKALAIEEIEKKAEEVRIAIRNHEGLTDDEKESYLNMIDEIVQTSTDLINIVLTKDATSEILAEKNAALKALDGVLMHANNASLKNAQKEALEEVETAYTDALAALEGLEDLSLTDREFARLQIEQAYAEGKLAILGATTLEDVSRAKDGALAGIAEALEKAIQDNADAKAEKDLSKAKLQEKADEAKAIINSLKYLSDEEKEKAIAELDKAVEAGLEVIDTLISSHEKEECEVKVKALSAVIDALVKKAMWKDLEAAKDYHAQLLDDTADDVADQIQALPYLSQEEKDELISKVRRLQAINKDEVQKFTDVATLEAYSNDRIEELKALLQEAIAKNEAATPVEPEQPTEPVVPEVPVDPEGPTEPTDPEVPEEPTEPVVPEEPTEDVVVTPEEGEVEEDTEESEEAEEESDKLVLTGDDYQIVLWAVCACIALAGVLVVLKKNKTEE